MSWTPPFVDTAWKGNPGRKGDPIKMQQQEVTTLNIPALALRGMTVFPKMTATVDVER